MSISLPDPKPHRGLCRCTEAAPPSTVWGLASPAYGQEGFDGAEGGNLSVQRGFAFPLVTLPGISAVAGSTEIIRTIRTSKNPAKKRCHCRLRNLVRKANEDGFLSNVMTFFREEDAKAMNHRTLLMVGFDWFSRIRKKLTLCDAHPLSRGLSSLLPRKCVAVPARLPFRACELRVE